MSKVSLSHKDKNFTRRYLILAYKSTKVELDKINLYY
ncbi:MAG: hypothetical protein ACI9E5_001433, partial [Candidatus Omnitrophota bacterium]